MKFHFNYKLREGGHIYVYRCVFGVHAVACANIYSLSRYGGGFILIHVYKYIAIFTPLAHF
jgi:hypothetical protein